MSPTPLETFRYPSSPHHGLVMARRLSMRYRELARKAILEQTRSDGQRFSEVQRNETSVQVGFSHVTAVAVASN
ncbi:MAG: hypothetical protein ACPGLY_11825 [Rubripirellula sp.]